MVLSVFHVLNCYPCITFEEVSVQNFLSFFFIELSSLLILDTSPLLDI